MLAVEACDGEAQISIHMFMFRYDHPVRVCRLDESETAEGTPLSLLTEELARGQFGNHPTSRPSLYK
jgi:hypothetical protein